MTESREKAPLMTASILVDDNQVYRGNFNASLKNPVLLLAETYDPATPLRNGRRLAEALGKENARLGES